MDSSSLPRHQDGESALATKTVVPRADTEAGRLFIIMRTAMITLAIIIESPGLRSLQSQARFRLRLSGTPQARQTSLPVAFNSADLYPEVKFSI